MVDPNIFRNSQKIERAVRVILALTTAFALLYPQFAQAATSPRTIRNQVEDVVRNRQRYNQTASASTQRQQQNMEAQQLQPTVPQQPPVDPQQVPLHLRPAEAPQAPTAPEHAPDKILWSGFGGWVSLHRRDGQLYLTLFKKVTPPQVVSHPNPMPGS
jgi:hypothetical protein